MHTDVHFHESVMLPAQAAVMPNQPNVNEPNMESCVSDTS